MPASNNCSRVVLDPGVSYSHDQIWKLLENLQEEEILYKLPAFMLLGLIIALGVPGNILVLVVYCFKFPTSTTKVFVVAMATFDLLNCLLGIPFEMVDLNHDLHFDHPAFCKIGRFMVTLTVCCSITILVAVSVDRFRRICRPLRRQMSVKQSKLTLAGLCLLSLVVSIPALVLYGRQSDQIYEVTVVDCSIDDRYRNTAIAAAYQVSLFGMFGICIFILCVMYGFIIVAIRKQRKRRETLTSQSQGSLANDKIHAVDGDVNSLSSSFGQKPSFNGLNKFGRDLMKETRISSEYTDSESSRAGTETKVKKKRNSGASNKFRRLFSRDVNPIFEEDGHDQVDSSYKTRHTTKLEKLETDDQSDIDLDEFQGLNDQSKGQADWPISSQSNNEENISPKNQNLCLIKERSDTLQSNASSQGMPDFAQPSHQRNRHKTSESLNNYMSSSNSSLEDNINNTDVHKTDPRFDPKTDPIPESIPDSRPYLRSDLRTDPRPDSKNDPRLDSKTDPRPDSQLSVPGPPKRKVSSVSFSPSTKDINTSGTRHMSYENLIDQEAPGCEQPMRRTVTMSNMASKLTKVKFSTSKFMIRRASSLPDLASPISPGSQTMPVSFSLNSCDGLTSSICSAEVLHFGGGEGSMRNNTSYDQSSQNVTLDKISYRQLRGGQADSRNTSLSRSTIPGKDSSKIALKSRAASVVTNLSKMLKRKPQSRDAMTMKVSVMMLMVTAGFVLSYLPHLLVQLYKTMDAWEAANLLCYNWTFFAFQHLLIRSFFINNALNPLIYGFYNDTFRLRCYKLLTAPRAFLASKHSGGRTHSSMPSDSGEGDSQV